MERVDGYALVGAQYKQTDRDGAAAEEQYVLREEAGVGVRGRVYDSRLLRYEVDAALALLHEDDSGAGGLTTRGVPRYSALARLLEKHPYRLTLFAKRDETRELVRSFGVSPLVTSTNEEYGARLGLTAGRLSGTLEYRQTQTETDGFAQDLDERREIVEGSFRHQLGKRVRTRVRAGYQTVEDSRLAFGYENRFFNFVNTVDLWAADGPPVVQFQTIADWFDRGGLSPTETWRISESVRWRIAPNLDSRTSYSFTSTDTTLETREGRFDQNFVHRLYESLTTTVRGGFGKEELPDGRIDRRNALLSFHYRKKIPGGRLRLDYTFDFERQNNDLPGGVRTASGESHVLADTSLVLLNETNVDSATVVVTDAARTTVYTRGIDYDLVPRGARTEVVRIPGGRIVDGAPVLVDYEFAVSGDATIDTTGHLTGGGVHLWNLLRLYFRYDQIGQSADEAVGSAALEQIRRLLLGTAVSWNGVSARFEYLDEDSSLAPFRQTTSQINYNRPVGRGLQVGFGYSRLDAEFGDGSNLTTDIVQGLFRWRIGRRLQLAFEPGFRHERGRGNAQDILDLHFDLRYTYGKMVVRLTVDHQDRDVPASGAADTFVELTLRRTW